MSGYARITVEEAERLLAGHDNVMFLDLRDARAYCQGHDPRAIHLSDLNLGTLLKTMHRQTHMLFCGHEDQASDEMANLFAEFGFVHSYSLEGGYAAWRVRSGQRQRPQARRQAASLAL